jgi:hypothetical protein
MPDPGELPLSKPNGPATARDGDALIHQAIDLRCGTAIQRLGIRGSQKTAAMTRILTFILFAIETQPHAKFSANMEDILKP